MSDSEADTAAADVATDGPEIDYRDATAADIPAILALIRNEDDVQQPQKMLDDITKAVTTGKWPVTGQSASCVVCTTEDAPAETRKGAAKAPAKQRIIGVIVCYVSVLLDEREAKRMHFSVLEDQSASSKAVHVCVCLVANEYTRMSIGTDLIHEGVSRLGGDANVHAVLALSRVGNKAASSFARAMFFSKIGVFRGHFKTRDGESHDAYVWGNALREHALATYTHKGKGRDAAEPVDLAAPDAESFRKRPMPRWLRDLLLYYVAPFGAVGLLFLVCYGLVVLGPLKGIGGELPTTPAASSASAASLLGPDGIATGADEHFHEEL